MAQPAANFPGGMPGEPSYASSAPRATGGKVQPRSPHGPKLAKPKTVKVKAHTRKVTTTTKTTTTGGAPAPVNPVNPDQSLIDAAVRLRYGAKDQALTQGLQQNARFSSGVGDWYKNALDEIRGLQAGQNAASQQALGQITAYNSPATLANPTDQQAANARNNLNAEFASQFGQNATSNDAAMARLAAAYGNQQGNTLNQANVDRQRLIAAQGALGTEKADYGQTYGGQLAQAEQKQANSDRTYNLQSTVAQNANLIKKGQLTVQKTLAQSLTQDRTAKQKTARSGTRIKKQAQSDKQAQQKVDNQLKVNNMAEKALVDSQKLQQQGKGSNKGNGLYTKTQLNSYDNQWRGAAALASHLKNAKSYNAGTKAKPQMKPVTRDVVYGALLKEYPKDPEFASAAADFAFGRPLDNHDLHVLATKGVHPKGVGNLGQQAIKVLQNAPGIIKQLNSLGQQT